MKNSLFKNLSKLKYLSYCSISVSAIRLTPEGRTSACGAGCAGALETEKCVAAGLYSRWKRSFRTVLCELFAALACEKMWMRVIAGVGLTISLKRKLKYIYIYIERVSPQSHHHSS
jgi:hypothetical protein